MMTLTSGTDDKPISKFSIEELLAAASPRPWYFDGWDVFTTGPTDGTGGHRLVFPLPHPTWHESQRVTPADAELAVRAVNEYEQLQRRLEEIAGIVTDMVMAGPATADWRFYTDQLFRAARGDAKPPVAPPGRAGGQ